MSKRTENLEHALMKLKTKKDVEEYLNNVIRQRKQYDFFFQFLNNYVSVHNLSISQIIVSSRINKNYVYNIINGTKRNPGRDKILALCIGAGMSFEEANESLEIGGYCRLNPERERDVWIAFFINNMWNDVMKINLVLEEHGLKPLEV